MKKKCTSLSDIILNLADTNSEDCWTLFKHGCILIVAEKVPARQISQKYNQPWVTRDVRRITRQKKRRRCNTQHDWDRYRTIKRQAQLACRRAHDHHVAMLSEDHENPKVFWQFIKSRKKKNFGVAPLKKDERTFSGDKQKADILNNQFTSVFTKEHDSNPPQLPKRHIQDMSHIT
jgi:hypothetical protein